MDEIAGWPTGGEADERAQQRAVAQALAAGKRNGLSQAADGGEDDTPMMSPEWNPRFRIKARGLIAGRRPVRLRWQNAAKQEAAAAPARHWHT